jgi:hypothetical protein
VFLSIYVLLFNSQSVYREDLVTRGICEHPLATVQCVLRFDYCQCEC